MINKYLSILFYYLHLLYFKIKLKILYCLNRKDCIVNRGNTLIKFNNDGDDQELLYIANWHKYYNEEFPKLKDLLKEGDVVIDVGANLGFLH